MQKFGVHVSIAGGVNKAPGRAEDLGCDIFQLFVSNPRSWKIPSISEEQAEDFKRLAAEKSQNPITVHTTYLPNLANPDTAAHRKATDHVRLQYQAAKDIGAAYIILHPGSHKKSGLKNGVKQICSALQEITDAVAYGPVWLLENTAGGGNTIGRSTAELALIYQMSGLKEEQLGICLDTCHAYASGINVAQETVFRAFCSEIESGLYPGAIKVIHLNDSMFALAAGKDRHQHIGLGNIGEDGMHNILTSPFTRDLPIILETPVNTTRDDTGNLTTARTLAQQERK